MTSDGVSGTAADGQPGAGPRSQAPCRVFIKRDDGRLVPRYMRLAYPHTPAGAAPNSPWCERQVASALRSNPDFMTASFFCGADGIAERACAELRLQAWPAAVGAVGPGQRPAKVLR
jgi:hypothetical protein